MVVLRDFSYIYAQKTLLVVHSGPCGTLRTYFSAYKTYIQDTDTEPLCHWASLQPTLQFFSNTIQLESYMAQIWKILLWATNTFIGSFCGLHRHYPSSWGFIKLSVPATQDCAKIWLHNIYVSTWHYLGKVSSLLVLYLVIDVSLTIKIPSKFLPFFLHTTPPNKQKAMNRFSEFKKAISDWTEI